MGQIQWIISLLPDSILNLIYWSIILAGITGVAASWLARWIPFYGTYARLLKPLGIVLIGLGVYLKGGYDTELAWRDKIKAAEEKAAIAEEKAKETNTVIQTKIVERVKKVKEVQYVIQERIVKQRELIDKDCRVPQVAVDIHNDAAKNRKGEETK